MQAMEELWTGRFELLTPPSESGDTGCFTNLVAGASDAEEFRSKVSQILERDSWFVVSVENCVPLSQFQDVPDALAGQIERATAHPDDRVFGTLHYFPSLLARARRCSGYSF
jgi:hypothetical protein